MSSTEDLDVNQEPIKLFKNYLIRHMNEAFFFIFLRPESSATGLNILDGIVSSLEETHQDRLKEVHGQIRAASLSGGPAINVREAFQKVFRYLHKTYLQDVSVGVVPMAALKPGEGDQDAPQEKIPERAKAKL